VIGAVIGAARNTGGSVTLSLAAVPVGGRGQRAQQPGPVVGYHRGQLRGQAGGVMHAEDRHQPAVGVDDRLVDPDQ
jgi:hypothetical protein